MSWVDDSSVARDERIGTRFAYSFFRETDGDDTRDTHVNFFRRMEGKHHEDLVDRGSVGSGGVVGLGAGTAEAHGPYSRGGGYYGGGYGSGFGYRSPGFSISIGSGYGGYYGRGTGTAAVTVVATTAVRVRSPGYGGPVYGGPVYGGGYHRGCW